jgi:predicted metalloprotease with PDZ domain
LDHPVELGEFETVSFKACGVPHQFVVAGRFRGDLKRLARDTKKICEYQIKLFGTPAPFERYVFMLYVGKDIYGGLEHRASTALVANRDDLPQAGEESIGDGYLKLLGLISHEYFHSWNVKRSSRLLSVHTICRARATPACCGLSRASLITTILPCCVVV